MKVLIHFITKYIFRALHLASFAFILGNLIVDYFFGKRTLETEDIKHNYTKLHKYAGVIVIISGLVNMALLVAESKFKKDFHFNIWKGILWAKLFATLSMTPLLEKVFAESLNKETNCQQIRVLFLSLAFLSSPFLRYYREKFLTKTQDNTQTKLE